MNTYLLLGALRNRAYQWVAPDLAALAVVGITAPDTFSDDISLSEAATLSGLPEHVLASASECARIKLPGRTRGQRFSRFALAAWSAMNDPAGRIAAWGAARVKEAGQR